MKSYLDITMYAVHTFIFLYTDIHKRMNKIYFNQIVVKKGNKKLKPQRNTGRLYLGNQALEH